MADIQRRLFAGAAGSLTWTRPSGGKSSVGYFVTGGEDRPIVNLCYRWADRENVTIPIRLVTTRTNFNGQRWWFKCPLNFCGVACNRQAGKLYLPPGARFFGCRICHDLSYRSAQEAHQTERIFERLGFNPEIAKAWGKGFTLGVK